MSDFYQSHADKLRFEILLKSLREGRLNLAILGDDEAALTHYGRRIFQYLREQGEEHVELWTSADSDRLVDRFNEILSHLTLDQALDKTTQTAPKRYMIFPDTHGIQDFELQLLARLVNGFPASNINVILLINSHSAYEKKLSAFGKNLLQWVLESEGPATAKPARLETLGDWPGASQVSEPPSSVGMNLPPVPPPPLELNDPRSSPDAFADARQEPVMGDPLLSTALPPGDELAKSWEADSTEKPKGRSVAVWLLLALLLTLVVSGVVYKERVVEEWQHMREYLAGHKPGAADPTPSVASTASTPTPTVAMSTSNAPTVKPAEAISPEKEELLTPTPAPAPAPAPAPTPAADPPAAPAKPTQPEVKETPKPVETAAPTDKTAQPDSPTWVQALDSNAWVMQHGAFDSLSEARGFQATSLGFKSGQVLYTQRKGSKPYYILVTGPYADKAQAQALMRENPVLAKAWLRTAKSLKAQFQE